MIIRHKFFLLLLIMSVISCSKIDRNKTNKVVVRETFFVQVNTNITSNNSLNLESDCGVLVLPVGYTKNKDKPTRMVIYCHSGSGSVTTEGSEAESVDFVWYLVSQGYAVMSMMGMPETYSKRLEIDPGRTVGSPISLQSNILGYKYVIENFNIAQDGCFIFSNSNGGLMACNIVNFTDIPVLAQSGIAPLISMVNAWNITSASVRPDGFKAYQNRANIIRIFGKKDIKTQQDLNNAVYEKDKISIYDPFDYCINQTTKPYRSPYLIFSGKSETIINYNIAKEFTEKMNLRGSNIILDDNEEYGNHSIVPSPIIVGSFQYNGKDYPLKLTVKKVLDFFKTYNPSMNDGKKQSI